MNENETIVLTTIINFAISLISRAIEKRRLRKKGLLVDEKLKDSAKL